MNCPDVTISRNPQNLKVRGGVWFRTTNVQLRLGVDPAFVLATKAHVAFPFTGLDLVRKRSAEIGIVTTDDEPLVWSSDSTHPIRLAVVSSTSAHGDVPSRS